MKLARAKIGSVYGSISEVSGPAFCLKISSIAYSLMSIHAFGAITVIASSKLTRPT